MSSASPARDRPLAIGHIHWAFPPTVGGVESHLADLAALQARAGHRVTVITGEPTPTRDPHYDIVTTPLLDLEFARRAAGSATYARRVRSAFSRILRELDLGVVHAHNVHHFAPEPALALDELWQGASFRLYHTFHETWPDVLHDTPVYRRWDGNYAVSRFVQQECETRIGFRPTLLSPGVDTNKFAPASSGRSWRSPPVVLHPARLLPWKGVHITVQAFAELRSQGIEARLILTDTERIADWDSELDSYRRSILDLITELDIREVEVRHAQYLDMPQLYRQADVVVYPTIADEPFGLVPLEAMSCGIPVVGSNCGGIAETVLDGETGFVVAPNDVKALTSRLKELVLDAETRRRLGAAARTHILERFDLDAYAKTLEHLYRSERHHAA